MTVQTPPNVHTGVPNRVLRWLWIAAAVVSPAFTVAIYAVRGGPGFPDVLLDFPLRSLLLMLLALLIVGLPLQVYYEFRVPRPD